MLDRSNYDCKKIHTLGLFILTTFTIKSIHYSLCSTTISIYSIIIYAKGFSNIIAQ